MHKQDYGTLHGRARDRKKWGERGAHTHTHTHKHTHKHARTKIDR